MPSSHTEKQKDFYDHSFRKISSDHMDAVIRSFYKDQLLAMLNENADLRSPKKVLEVGVGSGLLMKAMSDAFPHWTFEGIDISEKNISRAKTLGLNVFVGDAQTLDLPGTYDLIFGTAILHHLEDIPRFFNAAAERLNPGGIVLFGAEAVWYGFYHIIYHCLRGTWEFEKGLLNVDPKKLRQCLAARYQKVRLCHHGNPFAYCTQPLGQAWNALGLCRIPLLNDLYLYAERR